MASLDSMQGHGNLQVLEAVSYFLCPIKADSGIMGKLEEFFEKQARDICGEEFLKPEEKRIRFLNNQQLGGAEKKIVFGKNMKIECEVKTNLAWLPNGENYWVVLILQVQLGCGVAPISMEDLLRFNVGFRKTQGLPESQDSPIKIPIEELMLEGENPASKLYEIIADETLGNIMGDRDRKYYKPLKNLTKAVLLSYGKFSRPLNDEELFQFGSVAYPGETINPKWLKKFEENFFDRWEMDGWRCCVYSYSMVYAFGAEGHDDNYEKKNRGNYLEMGVGITIQRAWLQEFIQKVQVAKPEEIRQCHDELVRMQGYLGVKWTAEGTQRMILEEMWRKATGLDKRITEVTELLKQKIDLLEATKTDELNRKVIILQRILGFLAGAQIGVALHNVFWSLILWGLIGLVLCWILTIPKVIEWLKRKF